MKKALYFILLAAEAFVGTLLMIALCTSSLYVIAAITVAVLAVIQVRQIVKLKKATDGAEKRKLKVRIALAMLIPIAVFIITYIVIAIMFIVAFAFGGF